MLQEGSPAYFFQSFLPPVISSYFKLKNPWQGQFLFLSQIITEMYVGSICRIPTIIVIGILAYKLFKVNKLVGYLKFHHKAKNGVQIIESKKNKVNDEGKPLVGRAIVSCEWQISTKEGISSHIKRQESYTW
jgi:hypothetical protein